MSEKPYRLAVRVRRLLSAVPLGPLHEAKTVEDRFVVGTVSAVSPYHAARLGRNQFRSVPALLSSSGHVLNFRRSRRKDFLPQEL